MTSYFKFEEPLCDGYVAQAVITNVLFQKQTKFQSVHLIETQPFGRTLVLDGKTQSALYDEYVYHESLVHPPMLAHKHPKRVFVGGGGEMATVREILRHKSVEKVVICDIDEEVVDIAKNHLQQWNQGVFDDPRAEFHFTDAYAFLQQYNGPKFDVIIMDINDPLEAGPGIVLYTQECYRMCIEKMGPGGVFVTQSGFGGIHCSDQCFTSINKTLSGVFKHVYGYNAHVPSYASVWGFNMALNCDGPQQTEEEKRQLCNYTSVEPARIDSALINRLDPTQLRHYDGITHRSMFNLSKQLRKQIAEEKNIITTDNPAYMY